MAWFWLAVAGAAEVLFASFLAWSDGFTKPLASAGTIVFGTTAVVLLSWALREIPLSSGYAAFTALGTVGSAAVGISLRGEPMTAGRLGSLALVVLGVIGLRVWGGQAA